MKRIRIQVLETITSSISTFLDTKTSRLLIRLAREGDDDDGIDWGILLADDSKSVISSFLVDL